MELALFIGENIESDSLSTPLRMFARADLNVFRNHFSEAMVTLDSISKLYPFHALANNVNFRKAMILQNQGQFAEAAVLLEAIVKENSWGMLADDAIFQLAAIYETQLNRKDEAMGLYKRMLTDYPGSVYVVDARTAYRKLQSQLVIDNPAKLQDQ
jgi:TolA-binding protein